MKTANRLNSVRYNKSRVLKRAWAIYKAQDIRTMEQFSVCMRESWSIEKNGYKDITIENLYNNHYKQIFNHIKFKVKDIEIAEELTQDVFIKANEHLMNYDVNTAKVLTWLYTIAKNKIIDYYRSVKDTVIHVSDFVNDKGDEIIQISGYEETDSDIAASETNTAINKAFSGLKPKYREIANLYFIEQKKYDEISEILNIPLGTVKGMINRARTMLQTSLQGVY